MQVVVVALLVLMIVTLSLSLRSSSFLSRSRGVRLMASVGSSVPTGVMVDLVAKKDGPVCDMNEKIDLGSVLGQHKKCVLFAVPGAFTPTCSAQHLPGFIAKANDLKSKGVEAIYCLSVNDRFVMRAWSEATPGCPDAIKMVADGNADYTKALDLVKDATGSTMGIRSKRFAAIIENGKITSLQTDEKGLVNSSAEKILELL